MAAEGGGNDEVGGAGAGEGEVALKGNWAACFAPCNDQ